MEHAFRDVKLLPTEIARDTETRRRVYEEFPPAARSLSVGSGALSKVLKEAIRASNKTVYQIAQEAGVSQIVVSRFLAGERDIRMATADKLAETLRLTLVVGA